MESSSTGERAQVQGRGPLVFVTVGAQMPFDRLIRTVDEWAQHQDEWSIFAQIGSSQYVPRNMEWTNALPAAEFAQLMAQANLVVSHAGMGTILSALEIPVPILVMPREARYNETRNDHQIATAKRLEEAGQINVAYDEEAMAQKLLKLKDLISPDQAIPAFASPALLEYLDAVFSDSVQD